MKCDACGRGEPQVAVGRVEIYRYYPEADKRKNVVKLNICKDCDIWLKKRVANSVEKFVEEKRSK